MKISIRERELIRLVEQVRPILCDEKRSHQVKEKGLADFVTQADLAVQHTLQALLARRWPGIQFMGEEEGARPEYRDRPMWILDPIDGTNNLIHDYR